MIEITRSALLPYPASDVYHLVNKVDDYPAYLNGCTRARIIEHSSELMVAELTLERAGIKRSFITRNHLVAPERIEMQLESGPFSKFRGLWLFTALAPSATKVSFELCFEIQGSIAAKGLSSLISSVGSDMVNAMCSRAKYIYG